MLATVAILIYDNFRFLSFFLVVSIKKRNFGGKVERLIEIEWNRLYLILLR